MYVLYDPNTTNQSTSARQLLNPSNPTVIPANRIDPIGQNIVNLFPLPNRPGYLTATSSNFILYPVATLSGNQFDVRVDHKISDHDQLFGHASLEDHPQFQPTPLPGEAGGCCGGNMNMREQNHAIGYTHTFGSSLLNDLRFCLYSLCRNLHSGGLWPERLEQVGIPNANHGNLETSGLAAIDINGYNNLGTPTDSGTADQITSIRWRTR